MFAEHIFLKSWGPDAIRKLNERLAETSSPEHPEQSVPMRLSARTREALAKKAKQLGRTVEEVVVEACDALASYELSKDETDEGPF